MRVINVLARKGASLFTIGASRSLREAIQIMAAHKIGSVVVVDSIGAPVGILTEPDVVAAINARSSTFLDKEVRLVMRTPAPTCDPGDSVAAALANMTRARVRYLLVVSDAQARGIVSIGDLVKARLESAELETRVLREVARGAILAR